MKQTAAKGQFGEKQWRLLYWRDSAGQHCLELHRGAEEAPEQASGFDIPGTTEIGFCGSLKPGKVSFGFSGSQLTALPSFAQGRRVVTLKSKPRR
jgi:hypothetical protein